MTIVPGIVVDGRVEVENFELPEGAKVGVVISGRSGNEYIPTLEEAAEIEAGLDEIDRGEYVTLDEMMREVRAVQATEERKRR
jgi:hypothetical protein